MRPPRLQLFEFDDQLWFRGPWREAYMDTMNLVHKLFRPYEKLAPHFVCWAEAGGGGPVLDLCSGGGEHLRFLVEGARRASMALPAIVLSDLYPQPSLWEALIDELPPGAARFKPDSSSACEPESQYRLKSIFTALHHFDPAAARGVLQAALESGDGIFIAELMAREWWVLPLFPLIAPLLAALNPVCSRRFRLKKLAAVLSLLVPIAFMWDGVVSVLRTYTVDEILRLIPPEEREKFVVESGAYRFGLAKVSWIAIHRKVSGAG